MTDEDDDFGEEPPPANVMIVRRSLFALTDEAALIEPGRQSYLRVWPDDLRDDAGWEPVQQAPGLGPSLTWVLTCPEPFEPFEIEPGDPPWPLADSGSLAFGEDDIC